MIFLKSDRNFVPTLALFLLVKENNIYLCYKYCVFYIFCRSILLLQEDQIREAAEMVIKKIELNKMSIIANAFRGKLGTK